MSAPSVVFAVYGATRLAVADPGGLSWFNDTPRGFWHSFRAAWILAPFYLLLVLIEAAGRDVSLLSFLILKGEGYVISWVAYPLVMVFICRSLGRADRFLRYAVAYNWVSLVQKLIYLPIPLLAGVGLMAPQTAAFLALLVLAAMSLYSWYVARVALEVPRVTAAGIVLLDLLLALSIKAGMDRVAFAGAG